jgi:hypothetical protein
MLSGQSTTYREAIYRETSLDNGEQYDAKKAVSKRGTSDLDFGNSHRL